MRSRERRGEVRESNVIKMNYMQEIFTHVYEINIHLKRIVATRMLHNLERCKNSANHLLIS